MSDEQIVDEEGGGDWEVTQAIHLMALAVADGDPDKIALAMRRHAEALTTQAYTKLVPTLRHVLESVVKQEVGKLSQSLIASDKTQDSRYSYTLQQLGAFFEKEDARHDHYGAELSDMGNVLGGLKASQDSLQAGFQQFDQSIVGLRDDVRHVQDQSNINGELISGVKTDVLGVMQRVELVDKRVESLVNRVDSVEEGFDQLRTDVSTELDKVHARLETAEARLDIHEAKIELHDQLLMELHALDAARERLKGRRETTS